MLTENQIVKKVTEFLKRKGYKIKQSLNTTQKGIDIIAQNNSEEIYIEAKGETSSLKNSKRYGEPFNKNQVKIHISAALLATIKVISKKPSGDKTKTGIALPDNNEHRSIIHEIKPILKKLDIQIFWVDNTKILVE